MATLDDFSGMVIKTGLHPKLIYREARPVRGSRVRDGCVTCPRCSHEFRVTRKTEGGATYAGGRRPSGTHARIMRAWLDLPDEPFTRADLESKLKLDMPPSGFVARLSELVGMGLVVQFEGHKPKYSLDRKRAEVSC